MIVFDVDRMNELALEDDVKMGVIAHELAHVFLGHRDAFWSEQEVREMEEEADTKASEWGFKKEIGALRHTLEELEIQID